MGMGTMSLDLGDRAVILSDDRLCHSSLSVITSTLKDDVVRPIVGGDDVILYRMWGISLPVYVKHVAGIFPCTSLAPIPHVSEVPMTMVSFGDAVRAVVVAVRDGVGVLASTSL